MKKIYMLFIFAATLMTYGCKKTEKTDPKPETKQLTTTTKSRMTTTRTVYGTSGQDFLQGTSASEQIIAYASNDQVYANGGDDVIYGGKGDDYLQGNDGSDIVKGDQGNDKLYGGSGNDDLYGGKENDDLYGQDGSDKLYGDKGNDKLYGGAGNDKYYYALYGGYDVIDDASGADVLYLQSIAKSQVSVSYSGSNVILNVPSGRVTIKNGSVETVYANGQIVSINSGTPKPTIGSFFYTTTPLVVNSNETLSVQLTENTKTSMNRSYYVEIEINRSAGNWVVASSNIAIGAGKTTTTKNFSMKFNQSGQIYTTVKVYNANKTSLLVSRRGSNLNNVQSGGGGGTSGVPYYWQLNNSVYPYSSCQNTAIAMVINFYGGNTTPDQITNHYGKRQAQTVPGFQSVFNSEAAHFGLRVRDRGTQYGSMSKLNQLLAQGKPVMAHGYTTSYGHLVVFLAFDGTYYTVHDPYGKWDGKYGSSGYYKTATAGKFVKYHKDDVKAAFAPDGYIWLHEIYFQ
ncbi:C39 family peptidase [Microscilla marina]|nr:C39 family peptidase [Microscilla marina]